MLKSFVYTLSTCALTALFIAMFIPTSVMAQNPSGYLMTQSERNAIKAVIREFVRENPNFFLDVLQDEAARRAQAESEKKNTVENPPEVLYNSKFSPAVGPEDASIKVVDFFDYNCGYCKRMINDINRLIENYPNVQFIFKEMPILSDSSQIAARYALAAEKQGKYLEMHTALMKHYGQLNEKEILRIANGVQGLDLNKLQEDLYDTDIGDALSENMQLAQELGIRGTPFFVVNGKVFPGAVGYDRLASAIEISKAPSENPEDLLGGN